MSTQPSRQEDILGICRYMHEARQKSPCSPCIKEPSFEKFIETRFSGDVSSKKYQEYILINYIKWCFDDYEEYYGSYDKYAKYILSVVRDVVFVKIPAVTQAHRV